MATAIDVVREAFAALQAADMDRAMAAFAPSLRYRLHGEHPLAGEFDGKEAALGAFVRLAQASGAGTTVEACGRVGGIARAGGGASRSPRWRGCGTGRERRRDDHPRGGREHH
jgi:ketosteroid isomerase-like protein